MSGLVDKSLVIRFFVAGIALIVLFWLRWDTSADLFDWQVWRASLRVLADGLNPYDQEVLNAELRSDVDSYGEFYQQDLEVAPRLFNPPSWLLAVRSLGSSFFLISFTGGALFVGSITWLTRDRSIFNFLGSIFGFLGFNLMAPSISTFQFGQTGLVVAGLVALGAALRTTRFSGIPIALLAMKPHFALVAAFVNLSSGFKQNLFRITGPAIALFISSMLVFDFSVWIEWADSIQQTSGLVKSPYTDMSLGTLHPSLRWRDLGFVAVVISLIAPIGLTYWAKEVDAGKVLMASLALAAFLSGHAFAHDWLWLPLVPVLFVWGPIRTVGFSFSIAALFTLSPMVITSNTIQLRPVIGLFVAVLLVYLVIRERRKLETV